jgi:ATP-dependent Clp protease ATP-binding subunit ClpC
MMIRNQAKELRDRELELNSQIIALSGKSKEMTNDDEVNPGMSAVLPVVTKEDIRHIVSLWTGVPVREVSTDETDRLLKMEEALHRRVVGQDEAVTAISRAIRRARVGLNDPRRPIASFVFAGPTGVGKSELAKALAAYYYGSEEAMVRVDMSELMERHAVSKLIGSPPGYLGHGDGGHLTEAVRRQPYSLVLFDEVEKAHPDVMNVMLQILDDGRLTDGMGRTVDFTNTLIIMTSNIGGAAVVAAANGTDGDGSKSRELVEEEMKRYFRPEFLNRLDETIVFRPLSKVEVKEIAGIMVKDVAARVREVGVELQVTERFVDLVVEEGFDPSYGARPLRRAVVRLLEDTLADKMLDGEIVEGGSVTVDADAAGNVVVLGRFDRLVQLEPPVTFEI